MSTTTLQPWADGPFELLLHAEGHLPDGEDFDRRMALITFDNAIEVSITTYLSLKPIMRGNRSYATADVDQWTRNYHTKLDFLGHQDPRAPRLQVINKRNYPFLTPLHHR